MPNNTPTPSAEILERVKELHTQPKQVKCEGAHGAVAWVDNPAYKEARCKRGFCEAEDYGKWAYEVIRPLCLEQAEEIKRLKEELKGSFKYKYTGKIPPMPYPSHDAQ